METRFQPPKTDTRKCRITFAAPPIERNAPMPDLITCLREAKEGSRELDDAVYAALVDNTIPDGWRCPAANGITTDLSAAVALCERALPGWHWSIRKKSTNPDFFEGLVTQAAWSYAADRFKASHDCAPLALCLAILRAKASAHD